MVQTVDRDLEGLEVTITGRLASMSRDEAIAQLERAGASYVTAPGEETRLLVVGQGGPPLGEDGRLTQHLRRARELRDGGAEIEIVPEAELLARLDLPERQEDLRRLYTTAQLARILDLPPQRIRSWIRQDLIQPVKVVRRLCFFDFRQVALAKALSRLTSDGIGAARIRKSLLQLEGWWPEAEGALAQLENLEREGPLVIRTSEGSLAETSGQLRLDFEPEAEGAPEAERAEEGAGAPEPENTDSELWFRRGMRLEAEERPEEAIVAYAKALEHGQPRAELAFNLGNVLYQCERRVEAAQCFALATEIEPEYVEAWNNLGNAQSELGELDEAVGALERALAIEPDYADAHFNLGETLAALGQVEEAREHWEAYLEQDPHSAWAVEVRMRLARTE